MFANQLFLILILLLGRYCRAEEKSQQLIQDLFANYDSNIRGRAKFSETTAVYFTFFLHNLMEIDVKNQILVMNSWTLIEWFDYRLQWNVSNYDGLKILMVPSDLIWIPDIMLHNTGDRRSKSTQLATFANVSYKGEVSLYQQGIFTTYCKLDISYFPFDIQTCYLTWESWSYDSTEIELFPTKHDSLSLYTDNGEFDVTKFNASKLLVKYESKYFSIIEYTLVFRRRPLAYVLNLIVPCALINAIALLVFYMPSQTGEKVTLGINSLVSMTVFLINIKDSLPSKGTISIINMYYAVSMFIVTLATSFSVLTLNIYYEGEKKVPLPRYLKRFINFLSKMTFMPKWNNLEKNDGKKKNHYYNEGSFSRLLEESVMNSGTSGTRDEQLIRLIEKCNNFIARHEKKICRAKSTNQVHEEWKEASAVLDQFFLVMFILITFITSFAILYRGSSNTD